MGDEILLFSKNRSFLPFGYGIKHEGERLDLSGGTVRFRRCAGVHHDTHVKRDGDPLGAFCSDDPYYYLRTAALLKAMERNL